MRAGSCVLAEKVEGGLLALWWLVGPFPRGWAPSAMSSAFEMKRRRARRGGAIGVGVAGAVVCWCGGRDGGCRVPRAGSDGHRGGACWWEWVLGGGRDRVEWWVLSVPVTLRGGVMGASLRSGRAAGCRVGVVM